MEWGVNGEGVNEWGCQWSMALETHAPRFCIASGYQSAGTGRAGKYDNTNNTPGPHLTLSSTAPYDKRE